MPKTFVIVSEALIVCPQLIFDHLRQSYSLCDDPAWQLAFIYLVALISQSKVLRDAHAVSKTTGEISYFFIKMKDKIPEFAQS